MVYEGFGPRRLQLLYGFTSFASFNLSLGVTLHLETVMPFLFRHLHRHHSAAHQLHLYVP
ncbi:MAG: hypothetical protein ACLVJH_12585 [Faecalibacterium prausnitzii]